MTTMDLFIVSISAAVAVIVRAVKKLREPDETQNRRLTALEDRVSAIEDSMKKSEKHQKRSEEAYSFLGFF